jgi:hypothetical protein
MTLLDELEQSARVVAPEVVAERGRIVVEQHETVRLSGIVAGTDGGWDGLRVRTPLGTVVETDILEGQRRWSLDFDARAVGVGEHTLAVQLRAGLTTLATAVVLLDVVRYEAPRVRVVDVPSRLNTYDGFVVRGTVSGSEAEGRKVRVDVAGVTRTGVVVDGGFEVRFDDGALDHYHAGVRPVVVKVTDPRGNTGQATEWVTVDHFQDGFVSVDGLAGGVEPAAGRLSCRGEVGLGTHTTGRELVALLVHPETDEVVATGTVAEGWQGGEWEASFATESLEAGPYRVRVVLTDVACGSLTRTALSDVVRVER